MRRALITRPFVIQSWLRRGLDTVVFVSPHNMAAHSSLANMANQPQGIVSHESAAKPMLPHQVC
jgi:hypothetical protein